MIRVVILVCWTSLVMGQTVSTIAVNSGITDAIVFNAAGDLVGSDYYGGKLFHAEIPTGSSTLFSEGFTTCNGLVYDSNQILYVADNLGNKIYKVFPDGSKEVFVNFINPSSLIFELDSDTLIAASYLQKKIVKIAPDGSILNWSVGGNLIGGPNGFVYDENGNFYVCNFDDRKITQIHSDGSQTPLVQAPGGGAMGGITYTNGYIYASLIHSHRIFRTDLDGNGTYFMGVGQGTIDGAVGEARFNGPNGILASSTGDTIYVSDLNTANIRMITGVQLNGNAINIDPLQVAIDIAPNPTFDSLTVSLEVPQATIMAIAIHNEQGKAARTVLESTRLNAGRHAFEINVRELEAGTYFLNVTDATGRRVTKKVIVQ